MESIDLTNLPCPVGFAVVRVYRVLRHQLDSALRDLGLTTPQWGVLSYLRRAGARSGADIARIHCTTPQTAHTILVNLEHAGFIVRRADPAHAHILLTHLTDQGYEVLDTADRRIAAIDQRLMAALGADDRDLMLSMLERCIDALSGEGIHVA